MASKSRLGKGLGALFPSLPGEEQNQGTLDEMQSSTSIEDETAAPATAATQPVGNASAAHVSRETSTSESAAAKPTKRIGSGNKAAGKIKRASIPTLGELTHPSDMFFGGAPDVSRETSSSVAQVTSVGSTTSHASQSTNVESADVAKTKSEESDSKEKVDELKPVAGGYLVELPVSDIGPNAHQPRTIFDEDDLNELAASIKEVGVLQPIVVRKRTDSSSGNIERSSSSSEPSTTHSEQPTRRSKLPTTHSEQPTSDSKRPTCDSEQLNCDSEQFNCHSERSEESPLPPYELIMGERRWRASQLAGLETIPAIVKTTPDDDMLRDALLENLHRVALNPLEEAAAYQQMIDEFGLTQAGLSKAVSKSRPQIANTLRLLNLPATVQKKVAAGVLSAGHARALLALNSESEMDKLATRIIAEGLSVRSTEEIVAMANKQAEEPKKPKASKVNPWAGSPIQQSLENRFDTKVSIKGSPKHGRIEIVFSSPEDMTRILTLLVPDSAQSSADSWV